MPAIKWWRLAFILPSITLAAPAFLSSAGAQSPMACHVMESTMPATPPDKLPPPEHIAGVGNVRMPITASPEAQAWFTQGINLLHDFWDHEADRAFEQGIRVDPNCALCYWGL